MAFEFKFNVDHKEVSKEECLRLAEADHAGACNQMGLFYELPPEKDPFTAAVWYKRAANLGDAAAQGNLGTLYMKGQGVPRDPVLNSP